MFHVVEDTECIRNLVEVIIQRHGFETMSFSCSEEYIDFVNSPGYSRPVAVFTDVSMPGKNGYEMMSIVSRLKSGLKFVVMTGEPGIRSEYMNLACMYLGKPFTLANVAEVLSSIFRCHAFSPEEENGCCDSDSRKIFKLDNWSCPHRCSDCSSDGP